MLSDFRSVDTASVAEMFTAFGLIFGGCCSNALTLELITSQFPPAGTLITFTQFLLVALIALRKQLIILPERISRDAALTFALAQLKKAQTSTSITGIAIYGDNIQAAHRFAQDLSSLVQGSLTTHAQEGDKPVGNESGGLQKSIKFPLCTISLPRSAEPTSNPFRIVLQSCDPQSNPAVDVHYDISTPSRPIILRPRYKRLVLNPLRIRFKPRRIPIVRYVVKVLLFFLINLLNNVAFAYRIPMAVHIIFRSGGLVVNMLLGWLIEKRSYPRVQVASVIVVTVGVALATLSAKQSKHQFTQTVSAVSLSGDARIHLTSSGAYAVGIAVLALALLLSGILGLLQDRTHEKYGRGNWEESLFYLHALSLPLFALTWSDLTADVRAVQASPQVSIGLHTFSQPMQALLTCSSKLSPFSASPSSSPSLPLPPLPYLPFRLPTFRVPIFYVPLLLNVFTQSLCVSGVNRLTSRVNSLTVSLVLVVRKAVSLAISVLLFGSSAGNTYLWFGSSLVFFGTIGYSLSTRQANAEKKED